MIRPLLAAARVMRLAVAPALLAASGLNAQAPPFTHIYRLSDAQAARLYQRDTDEAPSDSTLFRVLVDTFSTDAYRGVLPPGHYLFARARWEALYLELRSVGTLSVVVLDDQRDLALRVVDTAGAEVRDAGVRLGRRRIPYDAATASYRLRRHNRGGFLTVQARGETAFFALSPDDERSLFRKRLDHFGRGRVGRVISTPLRWGKSTYLYFRDGIAYGYWRPPFQRLFAGRGRSFRGYIALSQPLYRPGDTLRLKAYVATPGRRPRRRPLELTLERRWSAAGPVLSTGVTPATPGAFTADIRLDDSLRLDETYLVRVGNPRGGYLQQAFRLEDYELDEVVGRLELKQEKYAPGEPVVLRAEARDGNGLAAPDVHLRLAVLPAIVEDYYAGEVLVPDTLWTTALELGPRGERQITLPDSIFPAIRGEVRVLGAFVNSGGERQEKEDRFHYDKAPRQLRLRLENGELVAEYREQGRPAAGRGHLLTRGLDGDHPGHGRPVALPHREPVNPYAAAYLVSGEGAAAELQPADDGPWPSGVAVTTAWRNDTALVRLTNPHRVPVTLLIRTRDGERWHGQTREAGWQWLDTRPLPAALFVDYHYVWGGEAHAETVTLQPYTNLLDIRVEHPARVRPGEAAPVAVTATDYRGRPAGGVNLVAGAVSARFGERLHYQGPDIRYRPARPPMPVNTFAADPLRRQAMHAPLDTAWRRRLMLDDSLFYQLRFPERGVFLRYDTIVRDTSARHLPQFAPYLVRRGRAEPIYLIYCNRELVYYYGVDDDPPYSFPGQPGYNQLIVRGRTWEYTLDSVWLRPGHKLELSVDEERYPASPLAARVRRRPMPPELTPAEKDLLRRHLFVLRSLPPGDRHFVWQGAARVHRFDRRGAPVRVGPFAPGASLHYAARGGWETAFPFEPGFDYELEPSRERLYARDHFPAGRPMPLPERLPSPPAGQTMLTPADVVIAAPPPPVLAFRRPEPANRPGGGAYAFAFDAPPAEATGEAPEALIVQGADTVRQLFHPLTRRLANLAPGEYTLFLFLRSGRYLEHRFRVRPDTLLFQNLRDRRPQADSGGVRLRQLLPGWGATLSLAPPPARDAKTAPPAAPGAGRLVTGQITDEEGEPLIGATVLVKGANIGAVTDVDGRYQLWAPYGEFTLVISYVGYASAEITGNRAGDYSRSLSADPALLENVVVTGYAARAGRVRVIQDALIRGATTLAGRAAGLDAPGQDGRELPAGLSPPPLDETVPLEGGGLRRDFRDYGWWQPNLLTDPEGRAFFTVRYPDNITRWRTYALGMDRRGRGGAGFHQATAFRELMAQLAAPRFLVAGDRSEAVGKALNYTADPLAVSTFFRLAGDSLPATEHRLGAAAVEYLPFTAPADADTLCLDYALAAAAYTDGERRCIPLFPVGARETVGSFHLLEGDTTLTLDFDPDRGAVTVHAETNLAELLRADLTALRRYPYECNEQTASRLQALLLARALDRVRGRPFDGERELARALRRLVQSQRPEGAWGWWPGNPADTWMTIYVLETLQAAGAAGYDTDEALERGARYLTSQLGALDKQNLLAALDLLARLGQAFDAEALLSRFDTMPLPLYERLLTLRIRQRQGATIPLDTLFARRRATVFGGHYWPDTGDARWHDDNTAATLLAYDILRQAGRRDDLAAIRRYFLARRRESPWALYGQGWRNTFETARVLRAILPDLMGGDTTDPPAEAGLSIAGTPAAAGGSLTVQLPAGQPLRIQKKGGAPVYLAAYQQFQNPDPAPRRDLFDVSTRLEQDGRPAGRLDVGRPARLVVEVRVKERADYVVVEAPIPAGCSYAAREQPYGFPETHREYRREKTAIFCEYLPPGNYTFTVELEPRFSGRYTLNPARVEAMYFPVLYGRNGVGEVEIGK